MVINHVSTELMTTEVMIPSETHNPQNLLFQTNVGAHRNQNIRLTILVNMIKTAVVTN